MSKFYKRLASSIVPPVRPPSVPVPRPAQAVNSVTRRPFRTVESLAEGEGLSRPDTLVFSGWGKPSQDAMEHTSAYDFLKGKPPEFQDYYIRSYNKLNKKLENIQALISTGQMKSADGADVMRRAQQEHLQQVRAVGQKYLDGHDVFADLKPEFIPRWLKPSSEGGPMGSRGITPMRKLDDYNPGELTKYNNDIQRLEKEMLNEPYPFN